jgi:PTS system mannose-specific IID component
MIPLIRCTGTDKTQISGLLNRHLQLFSTNPYLASPLLGSVVKLELEQKDAGEVEILKTALMGPYAAMGDAFFWGAWRPLVAISTVVLTMTGIYWAPLFFLIIYNPVPLYLRLKGFFEGYRKGRQGVDFIGRLNLPSLAGSLRWVSVALLAILSLLVFRNVIEVYAVIPDVWTGFFVLGGVLLASGLISRGISTMVVLYGTVAFLLISSF